MALLATREPTQQMPILIQPNSILIGVEVCLGIVGLIGNLLIVLAVLRSTSLRGLTHYFLLNLAIADSLVCITGIINWYFYGFSLCIQDTFRSRGGMVYVYWKRSVTEQSGLNLLLVTFERYMGIVHSLCHRGFFTRRKVVLLILLCWFTPLLIEGAQFIWALVRLQGHSCTESISLVTDLSDFVQDLLFDGIVFNSLSVLLLFAAPAAAMTWMYVQILKDLKQSTRRRQNLGMQGCSPDGLPRARQRLTHTLMLVTVAFLVLILPEKIMCLVSVAISKETEPYGIVIQCTLILSLINSGINPILYGLRYDRFQQAIVSTFCRWSNTTANQNTPDAQMNIQPVERPQLETLQTSPINYESSV